MRDSLRRRRGHREKHRARSRLLERDPELGLAPQHRQPKPIDAGAHPNDGEQEFRTVVQERARREACGVLFEEMLRQEPPSLAGTVDEDGGRIPAVSGSPLRRQKTKRCTGIATATTGPAGSMWNRENWGSCKKKDAARIRNTALATERSMRHTHSMRRSPSWLRLEAWPCIANVVMPARTRSRRA
jgi:hypothetical protein